VPDVFTIAHICTYRGLKNPIFVQVPRLVGCVQSERNCGSADVGFYLGSAEDVCVLAYLRSVGLKLRRGRSETSEWTHQ
jgi:hypothetical protein